MSYLILLSYSLFLLAIGWWAGYAFYCLVNRDSAPEHCVPENVPPWEDLEEPAFVRKEWKRLGGTENGWTESDYYSLKSHMQNPVSHDVHEA